jgi:hypothetical protein
VSHLTTLFPLFLGPHDSHPPVAVPHVAAACAHTRATTVSVVQRLIQCRKDVCEALAVPLESMELSMGMSADFELAVRLSVCLSALCPSSICLL